MIKSLSEEAGKIAVRVRLTQAGARHPIMRFFTDDLARFLDGPYHVRYLETNKFSASKDTLPPVTEIYIPQVIWYGRDSYRDRYGDSYRDDYRDSNL